MVDVNMRLAWTNKLTVDEVFAWLAIDVCQNKFTKGGNIGKISVGDYGDHNGSFPHTHPSGIWAGALDFQTRNFLWQEIMLQIMVTVVRNFKSYGGKFYIVRGHQFSLLEHAGETTYISQECADSLPKAFLDEWVGEIKVRSLPDWTYPEGWNP
jgi:hypothetical protein